jgi:nucleotidyltransferase-like protein
VTRGETRRLILLFETGLPNRYHIPQLDVRMDLLESAESVTRCPNKGVGATGRLGWATSSLRTSCGVIRRVCPKIETYSASTMSTSTCSSDGVYKVDRSHRAMMLIPLLWDTKMMEANNEFLAELASMSLTLRMM